MNYPNDMFIVLVISGSVWKVRYFRFFYDGNFIVVIPAIIDHVQKIARKVMKQRKNVVVNRGATSTVSSDITDIKKKENVSESTESKSSLSFRAISNVFFIFAICNFVSAYLNPISDCDETFNYWEPTHLLLYESGFQTWEYSPVYGLRSYLYVGIHAVLGKIAMLLCYLLSNIIASNHKIHVFYMIRIMLGLFCAFCQTWFINGIFQRFGKRIAVFTFIFLIFSSGMFNAAASMYIYLLHCLQFG